MGRRGLSVTDHFTDFDRYQPRRRRLRWSRAVAATGVNVIALSGVLAVAVALGRARA